MRGKGRGTQGPASVYARPAPPQPEVSGEERKWLTPAGLALRLPCAKRDVDSHRPPVPKPTPVFLAQLQGGLCDTVVKCSVTFCSWEIEHANEHGLVHKV